MKPRIVQTQKGSTSATYAITMPDSLSTWWMALKVM
jgi:hypothetical protein